MRGAHFQLSLLEFFFFISVVLLYLFFFYCCSLVGLLTDNWRLELLLPQAKAKKDKKKKNELVVAK